MKRLATITTILALTITPAAFGSDTRQGARQDVLAYAAGHPGFDSYATRCGPVFCRWYLDDLDEGRTCSARVGGRVRCSVWRVPTPDPYPVS